MDTTPAQGTTYLDRPVLSIMQTDVTTVAPTVTIRELTRILSDQGISGAPVTTDDGSLVGVVSSSDVMRFAAEAPEYRTTPLTFPPRRQADWYTDDEEDLVDAVYGDFFLPEEGASVLPDMGADLTGGPLDEMTVEEIMTSVPFTIEPSTSIGELASFLLRGRIHRAVVTEEGRCVGIVTTTDILRAVAEEG